MDYLSLPLSKFSIRTILIDVIIVALLCVTPTVSHFTGFSFYYWEPMRIALFAGVLLVRDKRNGYMLAVLLPFSSMIISGMPIPAICALMIVELLLNLYLFHQISQCTNIFVGMFAGILLSKAVFHLCKWGMMSIGLLPVEHIVVNWQIQVIVSLLLAVAFAFLSNFNKRRYGRQTILL